MDVVIPVATVAIGGRMPEGCIGLVTSLAPEPLMFAVERETCHLMIEQLRHEVSHVSLPALVFRMALATFGGTRQWIHAMEARVGIEIGLDLVVTREA